MAKIGEKELKQQIKNKEFSNAYFIYGEESYLKEFYVNKLKEMIVEPAFADFNFHQYNGKDTSLDDILKDAEMLPMMSSYVFIHVSDYPFGDSKNDCETIKEFLIDLPETTILVFSYDNIVVDIKKNTKWKAVESAFAKFGSSVNLEKRTESDLVKLLVSGCKKRGALLTSDNARYLISVSGSDIKTLLNETEKLSSFVNGGEITKDIINQLAVKCLQARVYDLSKAIVKGDYNKAYSVLDTLFAMKEESISVLSVISGCYVDMYRAKCAKIAGEPVEDVANYYSYKGREFALRNAMRDCAALSVDQLRKSLDVLMQADNALKSTGADKRLILEETLVKLLLISKEVSYD